MNRIVCMLSVAGIAALGTSASAAQVFRGFDNNASGVIPMASTPSSDAARVDFLSALSTSLSNDLEGLSNGGGAAVVPFGDSLTMTASGTAFQVRSTQLNSAHGTQGPRFLYVEPGENQVALTLVFSSPISALGFTFTDASDWINTGQNPPQIQVTVGNDASVPLVTGISTNQMRDGSTGFFGYVADAPFTSVTILRPLGAGDTDAIGFDGFIVPTPGAIALLGMSGLVAMRRRRSSPALIA